MSPFLQFLGIMHIFLLLSSFIESTLGQIIYCNGGTCKCPTVEPTPGATLTCVLNCWDEEICEDETLRCRAGSPCVIVCGTESACSDGTKIKGQSATDVTVYCMEEDSCGDDMEIQCGTGHCGIRCLSNDACNDFGKIDTRSSTSFDCLGDCPSSVPEPFTDEPTLSPTSEFTNDPSIYPTISPTISPSINPSDVPTQLPSHFPSIYPTDDPSPMPTASPTKPPSLPPSMSPSNHPSNDPSLTPSLSPSLHPTSAYPSMKPTLQPSDYPSSNPTEPPSIIPTNTPSIAPSSYPSFDPSPFPSNEPSNDPSLFPTIIPSISPSMSPNRNPSVAPTDIPSNEPTQQPSTTPSGAPSLSPSSYNPSKTPTDLLTRLPSLHPTMYPSLSPSFHPVIVTDTSTNMPTFQPSHLPTTIPMIITTGKPSLFPSLKPTQDIATTKSSFPSSFNSTNKRVNRTSHQVVVQNPTLSTTVYQKTTSGINISMTVYEEAKEQSKQFYISSYIIIAVVLSVISLCAGIVLIIVTKSSKLKKETKVKEVKALKSNPNDATIPSSADNSMSIYAQQTHQTEQVLNNGMLSHQFEEQDIKHDDSEDELLENMRIARLYEAFCLNSNDTTLQSETPKEYEFDDEKEEVRIDLYDKETNTTEDTYRDRTKPNPFYELSACTPSSNAKQQIMQFQISGKNIFIINMMNNQTSNTNETVIVHEDDVLRIHKKYNKNGNKSPKNPCNIKQDVKQNVVQIWNPTSLSATDSAMSNFTMSSSLSRNNVYQHRMDALSECIKTNELLREHDVMINYTNNDRPIDDVIRYLTEMKLQNVNKPLIRDGSSLKVHPADSTGAKFHD